jgi:hypothetical protein
MLSAPIILLCVALSLTLTIICAYTVDFVRFARRQNEEKRIQKLNETVTEILQRKEDMKNPKIIDITDYMEHPVPFSQRDAYIEEATSHSLMYHDYLGMWVREK